MAFTIWVIGMMIDGFTTYSCVGAGSEEGNLTYRLIGKRIGLTWWLVGSRIFGVVFGLIFAIYFPLPVLLFFSALSLLGGLGNSALLAVLFAEAEEEETPLEATV